jgi:hypothetical protein
MPTSGAVDLVAARLNLNLFETPTGMLQTAVPVSVWVPCAVFALYDCVIRMLLVAVIPGL